MAGCLIEVNNSELNVVAVDGFRLALRKAPINTKEESFSAIVPGKYLNEIVKNGYILKREDIEKLIDDLVAVKNKCLQSKIQTIGFSLNGHKNFIGAILI